MENTTEESIHRKNLKELSIRVKEKVDGEVFKTLNEAIIETFYKSKAHSEFKTMQDWNNEGFNIRKGAKPFAIWGKPVEAPSKEVEGEMYSYFPIRFLFSNAQVWKGGNAE